MAQSGDERAHEEKLRELAGPAAAMVLDAALRSYPAKAVEPLRAVLAAGRVAMLSERGLRLVIYAHGSQVHAIVVELNPVGNRRRYRKLSAPSTKELLGEIENRYAQH